MHDCPGWSQWLAGILIFTVAILWSRPRPKKKHWYFVETTYFSRNGIAVLKSSYAIALDRSGSKWPYSKYEDLEEEICSGPQVERLVSPR